MLDDDHLYLDRVQLAERGWTRTLVERFLPDPDRWATVDHWKNYTGKATYFVEKVMAAERLTQFQQAFSASVARRGLTGEQVREAMSARARVDKMYREWIKTVTPEDVQLALLVEDVAAVLESAGARGDRTPHK